MEAGKIADPTSGLPGNGWCYDVLIHSRRIAGRWLNQAAGDFAGESAKQLRVAAEHYAQIARLEAAREHDRAAVDAITTALETLK